MGVRTCQRVRGPGAQPPAGPHREASTTTNGGYGLERVVAAATLALGRVAGAGLLCPPQMRAWRRLVGRECRRRGWEGKVAAATAAQRAEMDASPDGMAGTTKGTDEP